MSSNSTLEYNVILDKVSVLYKTPSTSPEERKKASFIQKVKGKLLGRPPMVDVAPFTDLTLVAKSGESIGLVGHNGAGKSTLLRIVAGAESPASGKVYASSQPVLLGVSAALVPELSGYENARLGCLAMGMSPEEADAALPDIVSFTSIGTAIHRPMKTYSSGMAARLRFAISTTARPEILLIDEALATGDTAFKEKSEKRMQETLESAGTVFVVSHSPTLIRDLCNRVIWLHNGGILADGDPEEITKMYERWAWHSAKGSPEIMAEIEADCRARFPKVELMHHDDGTAYVA
ncbi:ABC transporter ATP-binding protein [Arcanobacterium canis]